ncbi:undecaprenyldiphospho-muramoylpentapeptide beta-N-acetylglucosaminyltransferase [Marilutibacter aestuarii]|uniref:UDP-N-acetylglucosamine--N-acetylmuramyl-(pentapeptide) pyrophosphoryl-undecaprenol N-acetylglucosamine transferase n=1 Tax=Marilutibacter aestuarii TaxID=1706195 RepID=A0A508AMG7_9GAMM|nr:undecaprenyldiphospho-muramoylpentapeptide beta-N-acetylglucosaminyltransferase [Lysobacter aestuarii]TQD49684.1 undecaprenyldiphospho-muramoylpentapeptide beta-N-acetylglucosaminyltransferase [Lysobacter aestuarii]
MTAAAQAPVVILAGGTGGHIFPGLSVASAIQARGVPVRWIGSDGGMETRLVPQHGLSIDTLRVSGIRGKGFKAKLGAPLRLWRAVNEAKRLLRGMQPRAVVSFGGFAAGPGGLAARQLGIPLVVHEQNRAPGLTNRVLARMARDVLVGFPGAFPTLDEQWVGNPVREAILAVPPPEERFVGREGPIRVLVLGGSQGARALNEAVPRAIAALPTTVRCEVRHQSGEKLLDATREAYAAHRVAANVEPFIADMAQAYAWADVVVCRAGALTLAEVCAVGVASFLVPFPEAVDDHQTKNAEYLRVRGASMLLPQGPSLHERLSATLEILGERADLLGLAKAARGMARPDAASRVADIVLRDPSIPQPKQESAA